MKVLKDTPFEVGFLATQVRPPTWTLTLVVKGTFTLERNAPCRVAAEQRPVAGETFFDDDPAASVRTDTDLAVLKPRGEFHLVGACYAPGGRPAVSCVVSVTVGSLTKSLAVFGDRTWRGALPSPPEPFTQMPLRYERSFGGPSHPLNPVGLGADDVVGAAGVRRPLPNLEDPRAPIASPTQRPAPVGFAPIPSTWPQRIAWAGTYDDHWLASRWPHLPDDFNPAYFNSAPLDQQIDGYWRGDEEITLRNLHPEHASFVTSLPGVRARLALETRSANGATEFREVPLRLDTVVIDTASAEVTLTWRGLTTVSSEKYPEVEHAFVFHDQGARSQTIDAARERFRRMVADETAADDDDNSFEVATVIGSSRPLVRQENQDGLSPSERELHDRIRAMEARLGIADLPPTPPAPPTSPAELRARVLASGAALPDGFEAMWSPEPDATAPPAPSEEVRQTEMRARVAAARTGGRSLAGEDLMGLDLPDADLAGMDFTGAVLERANLRGCRLDGAVFDEALLHGATLIAASLKGCSFKRADLTEVFADHADLEGAVFDGAALANAKLTRARLVKVVANGADAASCDLSFANLEGSVWEGANLSDANLEGARLVGANMKSASLERIHGVGSVWDGADLTKANMSDGAKLMSCSMVGATLTDASFGGAQLQQANLSETNADRADFTDATLVKTRMHACSLVGTVFRDARLVGAELIQCNARDAVFEGADASHADFRGSMLVGAEFAQARVEGVRLDLANVQRTRLA